MLIVFSFLSFYLAPSTGSGVLYEIQTQDDINNFVNNIPVDDSFSIVLPYNLLTLYDKS